MDWVKRAIELKEDYTWQELPELIYEEYGELFHADKIRAAVRRRLDKINDPEREGYDEIKPDVIEKDNMYFIKSRGSENNYVAISKDDLRKLKMLYCETPRLTINAICREMDLTRSEFHLIKTAFGITHDDVPFIDEDVMDREVDDLAEESLQRRKKQLIHTIENKVQKNNVNELKKFKQKDYFIEKIRQVVREDMADLAKTYTGPTIVTKKTTAEKFIIEPNVVDLHLGKLGWSPESSEDYDYRIARDRFHYVVDDVYNRALNMPVDKFLYVFGSDFWQINNKKGETFAGTSVDFDSRVQKLFRVGINMHIEAIDKYSTIAPVHVVMVPGNHDEEISYFGLESLWAWYHDSKVVHVWDNLQAHKYVEFGINLIGYDHGHKGRNRLPATMSVEVPQAWGRTLAREWHTGHRHRLAVMEEAGVTVRELSSMAGHDAWEFDEKYVGRLCRSQTFIWNRDEGVNSTWESTIWVNDDREQSILQL